MSTLKERSMNTVTGLICEKALKKENIKLCSREVVPGDIFFAVRGCRFDGHDFISEALERGAKFVVCEKNPLPFSPIDREKIVLCDNTKEALAELLKGLYGDPSSKLITFGITGTNGKTTTSMLIEHVLNRCGVPAGLVGTIFTRTGAGESELSKMTTPDVIEINRLLAQMLSAKCRAASIEVSSHALSQGRVLGLKFDAAIFTNLSPEHLDYHTSMENYFSEKLKIFELIKPGGGRIVNLDDRYMKEYLKKKDPANWVSFGLSPEADLWAEKLHVKPEGISFLMHLKGKGDIEIESSLIGEYNVYNILAASAALVYFGGISLEKIKSSIKDFVPPPGRMQKLDAGALFHVFVDYAHTPAALKNALLALDSIKKKRLICVVGCGGDRDKSKRAPMGRIATEFCDEVVFTSDNPRMEDPSAILQDICRGAEKNNFTVIEERREAILYAMRLASEDDLVLIAGKGHETYQDIEGRKTDFDDSLVARKIIKEISKEERC